MILWRNLFETLRRARGGAVLLTRDSLLTKINSDGKDSIFIDPLLSAEQIGAISVDLRLGYDFLVSVLGEQASISVDPRNSESSPENFFQSIRRDLGDAFLIHPGQAVLATSLEYVGLPNNVYAEVVSRSSYHRLGLSISSTFQPGFRGCISLELFNLSNAPIELVVGSRIVQVKFLEVSAEVEYLTEGRRRKYIGNVRPTVSRASRDEELKVLIDLSNQRA
ncbi:dCTP deaminase [Rhodobacterales bacterium HKCCE2091]|nr:dCTP deaminase [Rhodobacterales bacterium HKCCE2091]